MNGGQQDPVPAIFMARIDQIDILNPRTRNVATCSTASPRERWRY